METQYINSELLWLKQWWRALNLPVPFFFTPSTVDSGLPHSYRIPGYCNGMESRKQRFAFWKLAFPQIVCPCAGHLTCLVKLFRGFFIWKGEVWNISFKSIHSISLFYHHTSWREVYIHKLLHQTLPIVANCIFKDCSNEFFLHTCSFAVYSCHSPIQRWCLIPLPLSLTILLSLCWP